MMPLPALSPALIAGSRPSDQPGSVSLCRRRAILPRSRGAGWRLRPGHGPSCAQTPAGRLRDPKGFTLLELLIAVAVFAVVSAVAYGGLQAVMNADGQTRLRGEILAELQVALAVLERDLRQIVPIEPRDRFGDRQPALRFSPLATDPELGLVRAGSGGIDRLRKVGWRVTEEGLERRLWEVIDAADDREPISRVFLATRQTAEGIEPVRMELRFVVPGPRGEEILDSWPPLRPTNPARELPALVEIILEVPGLGRVERHLALPGGT